MKKIIACIAGIVGAVLVIFWVKWKLSGNSSVQIIGGADGPTAIFLAGKVGSSYGLCIIFAGLVALAAAWVILKKWKNKQ